MCASSAKKVPIGPRGVCASWGVSAALAAPRDLPIPFAAAPTGAAAAAAAVAESYAADDVASDIAASSPPFRGWLLMSTAAAGRCAATRCNTAEVADGRWGPPGGGGCRGRRALQP